jgi:hypothetical protein
MTESGVLTAVPDERPPCSWLVRVRSISSISMAALDSRSSPSSLSSPSPPPPALPPRLAPAPPPGHTPIPRLTIEMPPVLHPRRLPRRFHPQYFLTRTGVT